MDKERGKKKKNLRIDERCNSGPDPVGLLASCAVVALRDSTGHSGGNGVNVRIVRFHFPWVYSAALGICHTHHVMAGSIDR